MPISTHVLDTSVGRPAADVTVLLERLVGDQWTAAGRGRTDANGRIAALTEGPTAAGTYRLTFDTGDYFAAQDTRCFFPEVSVVFEVTDGEPHYHVPLLLSPFGYSTYRGS
jgi:5-hydroxyisourate hydrolase